MTEAILVLMVFLTSTISGMLGMAGGILLLSGMSFFFVPSVLIPLHGAVQLGSNGFRSLLYFKSIHFGLFATFALGAVLGALFGSQVVVTIDEDVFRLILGLALIVLTWMPSFKSNRTVAGKFMLLGTVSTFLSLFVGATGPLLAPFFLRYGLVKEKLIATKAGCQMVQHLLKMVVFGVSGFAFGPYAPLLGAMLLASFVGNYCGKRLLGRLSEAMFKKFFKVVISLIGVRLVILGLIGWL